MWRKLRKIFFWIVGVFAGLILTLAFVIWLMQDKIKGYAVSYLNDHLKTELKVEDIDVTFLSTFPNVSLHFKNVLILDPAGLQPYRDTLLSAQHIYVNFGLWDVLSGNYEAKNLDVYNAHLRAFISETGEENYDIVKKSEEKTVKKEEDFKLNLQAVKLYNTRLTYQNAVNNQLYQCKTTEMQFAGEFSNDVYDLSTTGDLYLSKLRNKNLVMFKNQESELDLLLTIDKQKDKFSFKKGDWKIGKMLLGIKGDVTNTEDGSICDVSVFGKNISLVSVLQLLPDKARNNIARYKSFGNLNLDAKIKGKSSKTLSPDVNATFSIQKGILIEKKSNISLHNIDISGNYTNRNKTGIEELRLDRMRGKFKDGNFELFGKLTDFNKPHFVFSVKGNFALATLHGFMNTETVKEMSGDISIDSKLDFILLRTDDLLLTNTIINEASGTIKFGNATVLLNEAGHPITDLNGQLDLKNNDALVDGLIGKIGKSDFKINGAIKNFTPYFISGNQVLSIVGAFNSSYCDINDLLTKRPAAAPDGKQETAVSKEAVYDFPDKINFNFDLNIDKLEWDPFTSSNIRGNFKLIDKKLTANNLSVDLAGGKCTGNIVVEHAADGNFIANATTKIENVQLPLVLKAFKNFGQELITPENSKGILSADVHWLLPIDKTLKIQTADIMAEASVNIKKGELNEVKQLAQIAGFMRTDKKMRIFLKNHADDFEERMRHLKFDELTNELTIKKSVLTIPKMEIRSSAMKVNFAGTHSFANAIDYHFNFRFLELKKNENETEFGEIRDDGTGIKVYIHMFGELDNPQYAWDKEEKKADRQEQWEQEKQTVKSLLKEEFGLFKKDTTVKVEKAPAEDVKFIMEWDEAQPENKDKDQPQHEKDNQKVKKIRKKLRIDENDKKDVNFEIEPERP